MVRPLSSTGRFVAIPLSITVAFTTVYALRVHGILGFGLFLVTAPAVLVSLVRFDRLSSFSPTAYAFVSSHWLIVRTLLYAASCLVWTSIILAPWWKGVRVRQRSFAFSQIVFVLVAAVLTVFCLILALRALPGTN